MFKIPIRRSFYRCRQIAVDIWSCWRLGSLRIAAVMDVVVGQHLKHSRGNWVGGCGDGHFDGDEVLMVTAELARFYVALSRLSGPCLGTEGSFKRFRSSMDCVQTCRGVLLLLRGEGAEVVPKVISGCGGWGAGRFRARTHQRLCSNRIYRTDRDDGRVLYLRRQCRNVNIWPVHDLRITSLVRCCQCRIQCSECSTPPSKGWLEALAISKNNSANCMRH